MKIIMSALLFMLFVVAGSYYYIVQPSFVAPVTPDVLRVGVLPDENVERLRQRYDPLIKYLSVETGLEVKLVLPENYADLIRLFRDREVDLAYFGGYTYLRAHVLYGARPLVMRDIDTRFISWFLVRGDENANELTDFKDKKFTFGSQLSTSGHLMPRYFLKVEKQIIPEQFFSEVHYSGAHDSTAYLVRDGIYDLGVANAEVINSMIKGGRLKAGEVRILWETPPYPDYVWAVNNNLDEDTSLKLRDAFLKLDISDPDHSRILSLQGADHYLPAAISDFSRLQEVAESLELLQ